MMGGTATPEFIALNILSPPQMVLLGALALIVFGPKRLPEVARSLGEALRQFRRASHDLMSHFDEEAASHRPRPVDRTPDQIEAPPVESAHTPHETVPANPERTEGHGT